MCGCPEVDFNARVGLVNVFVKVGFDDAVVIHAQPFAEGVLGNLEPPVDVSAQSRREIKPYR